MALVKVVNQQFPASVVGSESDHGLQGYGFEFLSGQFFTI